MLAFTSRSRSPTLEEGAKRQAALDAHPPRDRQTRAAGTRVLARPRDGLLARCGRDDPSSHTPRTATGGALRLPQWDERDTQHDYFVWKPDLDALLGIASKTPSDHATADDDAPTRVPPGPKPTKDWRTVLARWLIAVAVDDAQRLQNVDALVAEAKIFLDNRIGWAPQDNKDLRARIVDLLREVRF